MSQVKIFIPDALETKIKSTGKPVNEVILDLIKDRFQKDDLLEVNIVPKDMPDPNPAKACGSLNFEAQCSEVRQSLAKESRDFNTQISEYEKKGIAKGSDKESLESINALDASIGDMIRTHKETEKLIYELKRTVNNTKKATISNNEALSHAKEILDNGKKSINEKES